MSFTHVVLADPSVEYDQLFQEEAWIWVQPIEEFRTNATLVFSFETPNQLQANEIESMKQTPGINTMIPNLSNPKEGTWDDVIREAEEAQTQQ